MLNSSVRLEIGSGRSGNGLRCLEPGQKFRIFNSDHFTFLKNFNPTSGSRVSIFGQKFQIAQKNPLSKGGGGGGAIFLLVTRAKVS